jgi:hypothetical protein
MLKSQIAERVVPGYYRRLLKAHNVKFLDETYEEPTLMDEPKPAAASTITNEIKPEAPPAGEMPPEEVEGTRGPEGSRSTSRLRRESSGGAFILSPEPRTCRDPWRRALASSSRALADKGRTREPDLERGEHPHGPAEMRFDRSSDPAWNR